MKKQKKGYWSWETEELAKAARDRSITLENQNRALQKQDYISALQKGDRARTFRFLDLSPENRTEVYKYLMTFNNGWTCHPQILATCKQIRTEASNILYGENLLEVKIYKDFVEAHGHRCGDYSPFGPVYRLPSLSALHCPGFLRRAQYLRCTVVEFPYYTAQVMPLVPVADLQARAAIIINQIVYSLCSFLQANHQLRSFELDVKALELTAQIGKAIQNLQYPIGMLGQVPELRVQVGNANNTSFRAQ